jgi:hypothetical protein
MDVAYFWIDAIRRPEYIDGSPKGGLLPNADHQPAPLSTHVSDIDSSSSAGCRNISVAVLVASTGMENCCSFLEQSVKGLIGGVYLDGQDITSSGPWIHQAGLWGERERLYEGDGLRRGDWKPYTGNGVDGGMVWYKVELGAWKGGRETTVDKKGSIKSFAVYLGGVGRGMIWVNGFFVGRYWNRVADVRHYCIFINHCLITYIFKCSASILSAL